MKTNTWVSILLALLCMWAPAKSAPLPGWFDNIFPSSLGDDIPKMGDDLIRIKNEGQDVLSRHWDTWTSRDNWNSPMDTLGITGLADKTKNGLNWLGSKIKAQLPTNIQ